MSFKPVGELGISNADFKWIIKTKEFDSKKKGELIESPIFFVNNTIQKIHLNLYPKGDEDSEDNNMSLYLNNDNNYDIIIDYGFSLLTNDDEKAFGRETKNDSIKSKIGKGWRNFISGSFVLDPVNKLIKDDKITIVCNIYEGGVNFEKKYQIIKDINEKLFTNKKYSDVTVKCGRNKFYLHKCILANRSSVFEAMFETDMEEKNNNLVEVNDFDPKVLHQFFKYLYTNTVDDFKEVAKDLLVVADKYLVEHLKCYCEETMCNSIKIENAIEYLKISEVNNAKKLKDCVNKYITMNLSKFIDKPEFKSLTQEQLLEIMNQQVYLTKNQN